MDRVRRFGGGASRQGSGEIARDFARLPIFLAEGGREAERLSSIRRLLADLDRHGLCGTLVQDGNGASRHDLARLAGRYDLVLVNGGDDASRPVILRDWQEGATCSGIAAVGEGDQEGWLAWLLATLADRARRTPVWGCVLIGGRSSRMGRPKHLLEDERGRTWLERTLGVLRPMVDGLVLSGAGRLPPELTDTPRLLDIPGVSGPMAGLVAAMRWQPLVSWVVLACDMPRVSEEAVRWLLAERPLGCWGRVPRNAESGRLEPLFAWYDFRAGHLFEEQLHAGNWRLGEAVVDERLAHPVISGELAAAWANVNTPEQLAALTGQGANQGFTPR